MTFIARTSVLLFIIGVCCASLAADAAKNALKKCLKANDAQTKLVECSVAIESGTLSKESIAEALLLRASGYDEAGNHDEAIRDLDQSLKLNPSNSHIFDTRGWEYIRKFDYQRAIQDIDQSIQLNPKNQYAYGNRGIARFLSGDFAGAESDFAISERLDPKPARGYMAIKRMLARFRDAKEKGVKPNANAVKLVGGDLAQWPADRWPGPIVGYYTGTIPREAVLQAAQVPFENERKWKLCQAYFYLGEHALIDGNAEEAMELLQKSIDTEARSDPEFVLAQGELRNLRSLGKSEITREKEEMSHTAEEQAASSVRVETPADSTTNVVQHESATERHSADPAAIHPGLSTREEVRRDWACCDAHVLSDRLFVGTVHEHKGMKYLLVEFDENGIVSKTHQASPDDLVQEAAEWARTAREPLDLSKQMALAPSIIVFAGWRVRYFSGPITLSAEEVHIAGDGTGLQLKPNQLSKFRPCGAMKISLHHTCTGFGAFGVDVDAETPGAQLDVSGLPEIGSHLHILMKVPDLFLFVRYLQ